MSKHDVEPEVLDLLGEMDRLIRGAEEALKELKGDLDAQGRLEAYDAAVDLHGYANELDKAYQRYEEMVPDR